jgi:hypothetical protein
MAYFEDIPIERVELNIECTHHPELIEKLREIQLLSDDNSFEVMLSGVAAYCEVALDGYYTQEQLNRICTICTEKLRKKRMIDLDRSVIQLIN